MDVGKSGLLTLCVENQSIVRWAIRASDLSSDARTREAFDEVDEIAQRGGGGGGGGGASASATTWEHVERDWHSKKTD